MRVILAGRPKDRNRVRRVLGGSGVQVVAEADVPPEASSLPDDIDAVVLAAARGPNGDGPLDAMDATPAEALTEREREVLALLAEGLPNKAIARALGISDQTVKFHVAAIIGKLGAANRTDAVRRAIRRGLVAI
jgi:DNA-binding NarL/FixJ family response regulator